jgi:hypothetical protein
MDGYKRPLATLAGAVFAGVVIWFVPHFSRGTAGGYWGSMVFFAAAGLALGVAQLHGRDGIGVRAFLLAFVPVLVAVGWVLLSAQPEPGWVRDHVVGWSGDVGIDGVVHNLGEHVAVLAFGLGLVFGLTFEAAMVPLQRRTAPIAVPPTARDETTVVTAPAGRDPALPRS